MQEDEEIMTVRVNQMMKKVGVALLCLVAIFFCLFCCSITLAIGSCFGL